VLSLRERKEQWRVMAVDATDAIDWQHWIEWLKESWRSQSVSATASKGGQEFFEARADFNRIIGAQQIRNTLHFGAFLLKPGGGPFPPLGPRAKGTTASMSRRTTVMSSDAGSICQF